MNRIARILWSHSNSPFPILLEARKVCPLVVLASHRRPISQTMANIITALGTGLPDAVFDGLEDRFEQEMLDQGAIFHSVMVYGQKPQ